MAMASSSQRLFLTTSRRRGVNFNRLYPLPALAGVSSWLDDDPHSPSLFLPNGFATNRYMTTQLEGKPNGNNKKKEDSSETGGEVFDITKQWKKAQNEAETFWNSTIFTSTEEEEPENAPDTSKEDAKSDSFFDAFSLSKVKNFFDRGEGEGTKNEKGETLSSDIASSSSSSSLSTGSFREMATSFASILTTGGSEATVQRIVKEARQAAEEGDVADKRSNEEVMTVLKQYSEELKKTADRFLGDVDFSQLYPSSLFYFIEHSDSIKTPSWKRQRHRFFPGIDIRRMEELNDYLQLADLSYADSVDSIQEKLGNNKTPYEVVYVNTESKPNRPAHFIAVKRSQKRWSPWLEVIMCVRGTKTIEDAVTDLLCDYEDYRGVTFCESRCLCSERGELDLTGLSAIYFPFTYYSPLSPYHKRRKSTFGNVGGREVSREKAQKAFARLIKIFRKAEAEFDVSGAQSGSRCCVHRCNGILR